MFTVIKYYSTDRNDTKASSKTSVNHLCCFLLRVRYWRSQSVFLLLLEMRCQRMSMYSKSLLWSRKDSGIP